MRGYGLAVIAAAGVAASASAQVNLTLTVTTSLISGTAGGNNATYRVSLGFISTHNALLTQTGFGGGIFRMAATQTGSGTFNRTVPTEDPLQAFNTPILNALPWGDNGGRRPGIAADADASGQIEDGEVTRAFRIGNWFGTNVNDFGRYEWSGDELRLRQYGTNGTNGTLQPGVTIAQAPLGGFLRATVGEIFRFTVTTPESGAGTIAIDFDRVAGQAIQYFQVAVPTPYATVTAGTGTISYVPAPATLALLGFGGLVAGRRRR